MLIIFKECDVILKFVQKTRYPNFFFHFYFLAVFTYFFWLFSQKPTRYSDFSDLLLQILMLFKTKMDQYYPYFNITHSYCSDFLKSPKIDFKPLLILSLWVLAKTDAKFGFSVVELVKINWCRNFDQKSRFGPTPTLKVKKELN